MRRAVSMVVVLFAWAGAARGAEGDLAAQPTVRGGVSVRLPSGWTADPATDHTGAGPRTVLVARAPARDKDDTGEYQTVMAVSIDAGNKIDAAAQQTRLANDRNFSNYKSVEGPTATTIGGAEGVMFGGTFTLGPLKLRARQYMVTKDNRIYVITFAALESQWEKYRAAVEASVGSIALAQEK
jgi:hypothetical protein